VKRAARNETAGERRPGPGVATGLRLNPKGHLSPLANRVLLVLALLPILSVLVRALAAPVVSVPGLSGLQAVGQTLNQWLSLNDLPARQRDHALYLLLLPTCALIVAFARLTLGFRVLGFRSILISVGFHECGVVPSLILIAIAVTTIVLVRPWLRRARLPYHARVAVILCVVASTMVGALLAGPWMNSDVLWGVAYFPVIVLGMLAEGIANTLDHDNAITASWRAATTIALAFLIALVCWIPGLRETMLHQPELVVTQIVGILWVSEYLDLRLCQGLDVRIAQALSKRWGGKRARFRVVVVLDRAAGPGSAPVSSKLASQAQVARRLVHGLRRAGYASQAVEASPGLARRLASTLSPPEAGAAPRGIVLFPAPGPGREASAVGVASMLELASVPMVGPGPATYTLLADRVASLSVLRDAGVPIPAFARFARPERAALTALRFPVLVTPRWAGTTKPILAADARKLRTAVRRVLRNGGREAVAEERAGGRRIYACLIGNGRVRCLPLVELDARDRTKVCPTLLDEAVAERIRRHATAAFRALGCRDHARVDLRLGPSGQVWVEAVHQVGILARHGTFAWAAASAGTSHTQLLRLLIEEARKCDLPRAARRLEPPAMPLVGEQPASDERELSTGTPGGTSG
jgi:D-alanine-D-alanine ligase-like ATP-grasp enzyme